MRSALWVGFLSRIRLQGQGEAIALENTSAKVERPERTWWGADREEFPFRGGNREEFPLLALGMEGGPQEEEAWGAHTLRDGLRPQSEP